MPKLNSRNVIATACGLLMAAAPVSHGYAQYGGLVFDPTNYVKNSITAIQTAQAYTQQVMQYAETARQTAMMVANLRNLPQTVMGTVYRELDVARDVIGATRSVITTTDQLKGVWERRNSMMTYGGMDPVQYFRWVQQKYEDKQEWMGVEWESELKAIVAVNKSTEALRQMRVFDTPGIKAEAERTYRALDIVGDQMAGVQTAIIRSNQRQLQKDAEENAEKSAREQLAEDFAKEQSDSIKLERQRLRSTK